MKRMLALALAAMMVLCLCACGEKPAEQPEAEEPATNGMPNPMTEYASLDEINDIVGSKLVHPGVMGVSDEKFFVIDCGDYRLADYRFAVGGVDYTFRSAPVTQDISGYYVGERTAFADGAQQDGIEYAEADGAQLARWFTIDGQYVLSAKGVDADTFALVAEELCTMTSPGMSDAEYEAFYAGLAGQYYDSYSQRAVMNVEADGANGVKIIVDWSSSASENTEWTMTARLTEDGLLSYYDCAVSNITTAEDGTETVGIVSTDGEGWFTFDGDKLCWTGAADESCVNCVFEKAE